MSGTKKPRVAIVGGPDVDSRLPLMGRLSEWFDFRAVSSEPRLADRFREAGYEFASYPLPRGYDLAGDFRARRVLKRVLREWRPDLVHTFDTKPAIFGRWAALKVGTPAILGTLPGLGGLYTYHTLRVLWRRRIFEMMHRFVAPLCAGTIFQNREDLERFVSMNICPPERALLIRGSGCDSSRFDPNRFTPKQRRLWREEHGLAEDRPVVLALGRMIRAKGWRGFMILAERLREHPSRPQFVCCGPHDPEAVDALTAQDLNLLKQKTIYLGPRTDVAQVIQASDLVVFPSYYREGIPRALVEASLLAKPVAASDIAGHREVIRHGESGLLFRRKDLASLVEATRQLLDHPDAAQAFGQRARIRALRDFDLEKIAEEHRRLYFRVLETSRGSVST